MTIGVLAMPVSATAAGATSGSTRYPYACGTWTFPATRTYVATTGNLLAGAKKGAKTNWNKRATACAGARKQMAHAYWKNAHMFIPSWKCVTQYGTATCTRSQKEILFVFS
jgi:hypothetical protein